MFGDMEFTAKQRVRMVFYGNFPKHAVGFRESCGGFVQNLPGFTGVELKTYCPMDNHFHFKARVICVGRVMNDVHC